MANIIDLARIAYRPWETDGVPPSGAHQPEKAEIIALFGEIYSALAAIGIVSAITVSKNTKANLDADLAYAAGTLAIVTGDSTPANNAIYRKSGGSGSGSWTSVLTLDVSVAGQVAALSATLAVVQADTAALKSAAIANLSPATGNGTIENVTVGDVVTPTLRLVQTGGNPGTKDTFPRLYYINTPAGTNTVANITLKIDDGPHLPFVPYDNNTVWPIGGLPTTGKMVVIADGGRYRLISPYGASIPLAEYGLLRRTGTYHVGTATVVQNESGVTIYTFVSDDIPSGVMNVDGRFQGMITGFLPAANETAKAKFQILRSNGTQVTPKIEVRTSSPIAEIRAGALRQGFYQFTPRPDADPNKALFLLVGGLQVGGDGGFDDDTADGLLLTLRSMDDPVALLSEVDALSKNFEAQFADYEGTTERARAAIGAGLSSSAPGRLGVGDGYATTLLIGDVPTVNGALTDAGWAVDTLELGPFIRVDGALAKQSPQPVAQPNVVFFEAGVDYEVTFVLARLDEGTNGGDLVRLGVQFMKGDFTATATPLNGRLEVYSDEPEVSEGVITITATMSYSGEDVDFPIPADARCGRAYGLFNGNTPVTAFIIAKIEEKVAGDFADVTELTDRVAQAEAVLETVPREVETLSSKTVIPFLDGEGRNLGSVVNGIDGVAWDLPRLLSVRLPGGFVVEEVETLALKTAMFFTDADGRDAAGGLSEEFVGRVASAEARVTATENRATSAEARLEQLEHGVVNRRYLARTNMLTAMLKGGDVSFAKLKVALVADSKTERAGWARTLVKAGRKIYGDGGAGTIRLFDPAGGYGSAEDGETFANPASPTTAVIDRSYTITTTGTWALRGPKDNDTGTSPPNSVFLTSGTATAAASVTVTAKAGLTTQTSVKLYYSPASGASCRYRINTGAWAVLDLSSGYVATLGSPSLSFAAGDALTIEWVSGSVEINGLRCLNGQAGIVVDKIARSGSRLVQHWSVIAQTEGFGAQFVDMNPDIVVIAGATNDDAEAAALAAAVAGMITRFRTLVPWTGQLGLDVAIAAPAVWMGVNGLRMLSYQSALKDMAPANRAAYLRLQDGFPLGPNGETAAYQDPAYWDNGKHEQNPFGMSASAGQYLPILGL